VEAQVKDLRDFARYFCAMALDAEPNPELKLAFRDLRELKVDPSYPFLLEMYHDYTTGTLSATDFIAAVRFIESYVFRRAICSVPPNSLNRIFANFTKVLKKDRYLESIQAHLLGLQSQQRFPDDEEFRRDIQIRDLYNFRSRSYWLRRLENHGRKERVAVEEYTIEHILPQNENLSTKWREALGPEWKRIQKEWLHTLGNLTLTGYNSDYSDRSFAEKRDYEAPKGFMHSPLQLNAGLGQLAEWTEDAIKARAKKLASMAVEVWKSPSLTPEVLASYLPSKPTGAAYTINDHPNLLSGPMKDLFAAFGKEVMALDPCVIEEFLKNYVAYKAETNFVDVKPQTKALRLALNMAFTEINDPRGLCKDVSAVGHWGNGDVEVGLASLNDLPYTLGLVRQSFERQMGSEGDV
jgi:predicted transport protein